MKTIDLSTYKKCKPFILHTYAIASYQKRITDEKGTKYFINVAQFEDGKGDRFCFDVQFTYQDRSINIETVSWTNDPEEKHRPYPTIKEIEDMFEKMWLAYGGEYYESTY